MSLTQPVLNCAALRKPVLPAQYSSQEDILQMECLVEEDCIDVANQRSFNRISR
jgi:hypothetical protein